MDLVMLPAAAHPAHLAALKEEKQAGRVRYIGVQTISAKFQSAQLETLMRDEPIDFVGVDYDAGNRHVEGTILPLAQERKIGVMAFFPFGNNGGVSCGSGANLFGRVGSRPLPGGPRSSTPRRGRTSSSSTSSATRPSRWPGWGRPRRTTWSTTSAAASAACRTRRRASAWRRSSMPSRRLR
jgi:hypothetical protein